LEASIFYTLGITLFIVGVIIIITAIIIASTGSPNKGKMKGAGVIMIGPIPIIFGTDKKSVKTVIALALALSIIMLIIIVIYWLMR
jgi:uncharacterized protein (TIGR00304 family)